MSNIIKCYGITDDEKKQLEALKIDLENASNGEALSALLEVYERDPELVLEPGPRDGFRSG